MYVPTTGINSHRRSPSQRHRTFSLTPSDVNEMLTHVLTLKDRITEAKKKNIGAIYIDCLLNPTVITVVESLKVPEGKYGFKVRPS